MISEDEYINAMEDARYEAEMEEYYDTDDCTECPECGEMTLRTGKTISYRESPDETPIYCLNCDYEDVI